MRSRSWAAGTVTVLSCFVAAYACGCLINTQDDCELGCIGSGGASTTSSGTSIVDPSCIPSEATGTVENTCGIFASSSGGDDMNPGTKELPVKTVGKAIELASSAGGVVYGCAEDFQESVDLTSSVHIYGGLDCANGWAYIGDSQKTKLTALPDAIPLKIESGISATIQDLHALAAAAMAPGGSSIAVIADGATARFVGCTLEAGGGATGQNGAPYMMPAAAGTDGNLGGMACSANQITGGDAPMNMCGAVASAGGFGGTGTPTVGFAGLPGDPMGSDNGGAGASAMTDCTPGSPGDNGQEGAVGSTASGLGSINNNGYTGVTGGDGTPGTPGQGGGGGGGSKGGTGAGKCTVSTSAGGASGGSGASGGCGGLGGRGGGAGGASIAVVSVGANLTFDSSQIVTKNGGVPGTGGPGQDGGAGGPVGGAGGDLPSGANMLKPGCAGGRGGAGGKGGAGGNGLGGHSIGIAFTGTAPTLDTATTFTTGAGATGGMKQDTQEFP